MEGSWAHVTVRFVSDQVNVTRDAEGNILDGDPEQLAEIVDLWTFARDTSSRDPNWELVSTGVGE
jgi:predicted lipid-binding transport protein (Tim44 family)